MEAYQLDLDNRPFVRQLLAAFPITEIVQTSAYLEVVRSDGHRPLWVHRGYTLGFMSATELSHMSDRGEIWPCHRGWGITHPVHGHPSSDQLGHKVIQGTEICPQCFLVKALSGSCFCDE